eukprot:533437-Karenia_brevis.AAC.1
MSVVLSNSCPGNSPAAHLHSPGMPRSSAQAPKRVFQWILSTSAIGNPRKSLSIHVSRWHPKH